MERALLLTGVLVSCLTACTEANPASCLDGHCSDPARPFCDVDGALSGTPHSCVKVSCTTGDVLGCRDAQALTCNSAGDNYDLVECAHGCGGSPAACLPCSDCERHIVPRFVPNACDTPSDGQELRVQTSTTLNTSMDSQCTGGIVSQLNGPEICVVNSITITIERNQTLRVSGKRALALVADDALIVDGILDISADRAVDGPGGGLISGARPAHPSGSGGAGFKTAGAAGGSANADGGGGAGGDATTIPIEPLLGGSRAGAYSVGMLSPGGGGGGAATLLSCTGSVEVSGIIDAGGGGGAPAGYDGFNFVRTPAGGGGAGGVVALQGMDIRVTGEIYSNGGGGGAGLEVSGAGSGMDGSRSSTAAGPGGMVGLPEAGNGGGGGYGTTAPTVGRRFTAGGLSSGAGGGGGSVGAIRTFTPAGTTPTLTPLDVSPPPDANGSVGIGSR